MNDVAPPDQNDVHANYVGIQRCCTGVRASPAHECLHRRRLKRKTRKAARSVGPLVAVVIPAFNVSSYWRDFAFRIGQTYRRLELIVIDDALTDARPRLWGAERGGFGPCASRSPTPTPQSRVRLVNQTHSVAARRLGLIVMSDQITTETFSEKLEAEARILLVQLFRREEQTLVRCRLPPSFEGDVLAAVLSQHFIGKAVTMTACWGNTCNPPSSF
jgi:hypothetical protein